jgi:hypothetical protein
VIGPGAPSASTWSADDGLHVDVRGMQAPQPMVLILQLVQQVGPDGVLIVHHDRDPLLLYPELVQIGWWAERIDGDPGEVRLRLAAAS